MNVPLLAFGLFITFIAFVHGGAVKSTLTRINRYLINEDSEHLVAYGIMSFALVVLITCLLNWSWFYHL